ncbi:hypothetical protein VTK73DRAFT_6496 [Phialemonium thermophilum]|uniref:Uncharacterized protein n=1 Tax=Phialemonium thermophilum TaxID=223376 RepID=A0ABR3UZM6_9PEZI
MGGRRDSNEECISLNDVRISLLLFCKTSSIFLELGFFASALLSLPESQRNLPCRVMAHPRSSGLLRKSTAAFSPYVSFCLMLPNTVLTGREKKTGHDP